MERMSNVNSNILALAEKILAPTAAMSALGYFLGWSVNAAYYLSFGLSPSLIRKSFSEMITAAWVELGIGIICVIAGTVIYQIAVSIIMAKEQTGQKLHDYLLPRFYFAFVLSVAGVMFSLYLTFLSRLRIGYLALFGVSIALFWIATIVGSKLRQLGQEGAASFRANLFRVVFPNAPAYYIALTLVLVYLLSRVGVWRGVYLGERDMNQMGELPLVTIYSREPLFENGTLDPQKSLYVYSDLELIDSNADFLLVFKRPLSTQANQQVQNSTFVIPLSSGIIFEIKY